MIKLTAHSTLSPSPWSLSSNRRYFWLPATIDIVFDHIGPEGHSRWKKRARTGFFALVEDPNTLRLRFIGETHENHIGSRVVECLFRSYGETADEETLSALEVQTLCMEFECADLSELGQELSRQIHQSLALPPPPALDESTLFNHADRALLIVRPPIQFVTEDEGHYRMNWLDLVSLTIANLILWKWADNHAHRYSQEFYTSKEEAERNARAYAEEHDLRRRHPDYHRLAEEPWWLNASLEAIEQCVERAMALEPDQLLLIDRSARTTLCTRKRLPTEAADHVMLEGNQQFLCAQECADLLKTLISHHMQSPVKLRAVPNLPGRRRA
jgi:hypothetical protein